jgi:archaellin
MSNWRNTGITTIILLIVILLIAMTVTSTITQETTGTTTEHNYDQMVDETIDEISTYIQIRDQKGKFSDLNGEKKIGKIALLISPLVSQDIDLTGLMIQLDNGETVRMLNYIGFSLNLESVSLFKQSIWDSLIEDNFGFITIYDLDNSITEYNLINDYSDNTYLVFKLPVDMTLAKHDKITVTLFPSTGITRATILKAPMPIKSVITFE